MQDKISYEIENQATILNNYAQLLHYVIKEMEQGKYSSLCEDRKPTLDDESARVVSSCIFILDGMKTIRDDLYKLYDDMI